MSYRMAARGKAVILEEIRGLLGGCKTQRHITSVFMVGCKEDKFRPWTTSASNLGSVSLTCV